MQTAQAVIENHYKVVQINASSHSNGIGGWLTRLFGCRHKEMSRPLSIQGQTYRTCLDCGARRQFNVGRWEMQGDFYYGSPSDKYFGPLRRLAA
jgi:hypothetical protein